jgi:hypothetical protein
MNIISIKNVWFDDAATFATGEAFDNACKTLQNFGSTVPAIIAGLIIAAAKNGERATNAWTFVCESGFDYRKFSAVTVERSL